MDPSITSIVESRRKFASQINLYPNPMDGQPRLLIDRFDKIVSVSYETVVDVNGFPRQQVEICIDKESGKLTVCGYREEDGPEFGFKSDFFKELNIPFGVDMDRIKAIYDVNGLLHFNLPSKKPLEVDGIEMPIISVNMGTLSSRAQSSERKSANVHVTGSPAGSSKNAQLADLSTGVKSLESESTEPANDQLSLAKSMANLDTGSTGRTIWDRPYGPSPVDRTVAIPVSSGSAPKPSAALAIGKKSTNFDLPDPQFPVIAEEKSLGEQSLLSGIEDTSKAIKHATCSQPKESLGNVEEPKKPSSSDSLVSIEEKIKGKIKEVNELMEDFKKSIIEKKAFSGSGEAPLDGQGGSKEQARERIIPIVLSTESYSGEKKKINSEQKTAPASLKCDDDSVKQARVYYWERVVSKSPQTSSPVFKYNTVEYMKSENSETEV